MSGRRWTSSDGKLTGISPGRVKSVNAKSGGCAEDCGFCAQSRYAEAATPMHAMMEPEQILEHARAAEAAGAHRFCMVHLWDPSTQLRSAPKRHVPKRPDPARPHPEVSA